MALSSRVEVRVPSDDSEVRGLADVAYQSFAGFNQPYERTIAWLGQLGTENLRIVTQDGRVVAGLGILDFGQWFGGRSVRSAGISTVGVAPDVRGSGLAAGMMRAVIAELAERDMPLSVLFPSTYALYRKAGYEPAGARIRYQLDAHRLGVREHTRFIRPLTPGDRPEVHRVYSERARRSAGQVDRTPRDWERIFTYGTERVYAYGIESESAGGRLDGYVLYTQTGMKRGPYEIEIRDATAITPAAARRLLTFFVDHATMAQHIVVDSGPNDPLMCLAREDHAEVRFRINWMLRVVNARAALAARGYPPGLSAELHFDLRDDLIEQNAGRFILTVAEGRGRVEAGGQGRIPLDVRGLAPLFTGRLSALELQVTGLIDGPQQDLALAGAAFGGPAPWMSDRF